MSIDYFQIIILTVPVSSGKNNLLLLIEGWRVRLASSG